MEIVIDGSDSDDSDSNLALSRSPLLTRPEVFKRRTRHLKQLSKIYKDHYWSLMEDLKLKYRDYYWDYGKSPFLKDEDILHSLNRNHSNNYGTTIIPDDIQHPLNNDEFPSPKKKGYYLLTFSEQIVLILKLKLSEK
ncbi:hypothetical protein LOK49_LG07G02619 [Camellia lanceoleosa]|uniref:Uncharacterized protein n=1 Tax=Camellia lanceoleosa TaxID=1840588 RepID=A0ACC0GY36_9ERIC|nr:hypothetical protein LOK49_LG07G02619 [Camellia lanceoleosa]